MFIVTAAFENGDVLDMVAMSERERDNCVKGFLALPNTVSITEETIDADLIPVLH